MKKKIIGVILSSVLLSLSLAGCQSDTRPLEPVNKVVESVFYMQDSEIALSNLGINSQEARASFISKAEQNFQSQMFPEPEPENDSTDESTSDTDAAENGESAPESETDAAVEDEDATEDVATTVVEVEIDPSIVALTQKIFDIMQNIVKYETKLMTLSSTKASVKVTVYPMDLEAFYEEYMNALGDAGTLDEEASDEEKEAYSRKLLEAYSVAIDTVKTSEIGYDLSVELRKSDDSWVIREPQTLLENLYSLYMGNL